LFTLNRARDSLHGGDDMIGRQDRWQEDLFVAGPLGELIPEDHILKRVDKILDLSWLRDEVKSLYDEQQGRPSIDPEAAVRLMLAGLFQGITQDRKLMREAQVNLAIRWFAGYRLTDRLPDHSSLTKLRQRWGAEQFQRIFRRSVSACAAAGLVSGETVHIDATLIRADVSWESLTERHVEQVLTENAAELSESSDRTELSRKKSPKKYSPTDPDATLTTSCKQYRMEPSYKQHTAVDDRAGVIVDVQVTTGEASEGRQLPQQIESIEAQTGKMIQTITADGAYAHSANFALLEARGKQAIIPPQKEVIRAGRIPARRFRYDARHDIVRCPAGRTLVRRAATPNGHFYRARATDCRHCPLRSSCVPPSAASRSISIVNDYLPLLRARRRRQKWGETEHELYRRHRWRAEGAHGEAKTQHGLRRAARRGLTNVAIQVYLTAAVMNLKRMAALRALPVRYMAVRCSITKSAPTGNRPSTPAQMFQTQAA
jgi:transposase